jgi:hypothetical protein
VSISVPADKLLEILIRGARSLAERKKLESLKKTLLAEFEVDEYDWLTIARLAKAIGLEAENETDRKATAQLLIRLPDPGPARASRKRNNGPPAEELWGLKSVVGP